MYMYVCVYIYIYILLLMIIVFLKGQREGLTSETLCSPLPAETLNPKP